MGKLPLRKSSLFFSKHKIIGPQDIFVLETGLTYCTYLNDVILALLDAFFGGSERV